MNEKDKLYENSLLTVADFVFDERVVRVFPDMIKRWKSQANAARWSGCYGRTQSRNTTSACKQPAGNKRFAASRRSILLPIFPSAEC